MTWCGESPAQETWMQMENNVAERIAEYVHEAGGRTFYVGGFVRDRLLGIENKDVDIEVHGIEPDELFEILKKAGEPLIYGKSFGVFALKGEDIDIAMPRREHARSFYRDARGCKAPRLYGQFNDGGCADGRGHRSFRRPPRSR